MTDQPHREHAEDATGPCLWCMEMELRETAETARACSAAIARLDPQHAFTQQIEARMDALAKLIGGLSHRLSRIEERLGVKP